MKKIFTTTVILLAFASSAYAESNAELIARIEKLEQELQLLKRKAEVSEEVAVANSQKNASVTFDKKGLAISSPDKNFTLNVKGYAQIDSRQFIDEEGKGKDDIIARRIRPVVEGTIYQDFSYRFMPDFAGSSTRIFDAHFDYAVDDAVKFRVGKFKPPIGLERLQSATDLEFVERGHPTNLAPSRDYGFQVYGDLIPQTLEYQVGIFNGNADLANTDSDDDNNFDIAARVFANPFRNSSITKLQGLGVGIGSSFGQHEGTAAKPILASYRTPGQQDFFSYNTGAFADGDNWRLYPQGYYYLDNYGLLAEYALSSQEVALGAAREELTHKAWQLSASYVLTGEDISFKGISSPENRFDPKTNSWGAFELVGRVGETDIDDDAFPIFANSASSASSAFSMGTGINWYWNENVKLSLDYENTDFEGGDTKGDRTDENVVLSRVQLKL